MRVEGIGSGNLRFGFSAIRETLRALEVLSHPSHHAEQMPWVRDARKRLTPELKDEIKRFSFLIGPQAEAFASLWPADAGAPFAADIARLRKGRRAYVESVARRLCGEGLITAARLAQLCRPAELRRAARERARGDPKAAAFLNEFADSQARSLERFCRMLERFHATVVSPKWGDIERRLDEDVKMRRRIVREYGVPAALRTLSPDIKAFRASKGAGVAIEKGGDRCFPLSDGATLTLTPSYFVWPHISVFVLRRARGLDCRIAYPVPPLTSAAATIENSKALASRLAALGEPTRLRMVDLLARRDLSTRELAGFLKLSESSINRHLRMLEGAGLVSRHRSGYFVLYRLHRAVFRDLSASMNRLC